MNDLMHVQGIAKVYQKAQDQVDVIEDVHLRIAKRESIAIMGESGAGKSTLLQVMGGLLSPSKGKVLVDGVSLYDLRDAQRAQIRNQKIGFVFQFHYLLPEFTALENVCMPARIARQHGYEEKAKALLIQVGLEHRLTHKPSELSGGEQQRVAIARALMMQPSILLADEPTGNLDQKTSDQVAQVLFSLMQEKGALVLVTHSMRLAEKADKVYRLTKGELVLE
ncbi:MAG: ABC transporter ATP-binding protein [Bdellovibrionota bacterium]